MKLGLIFPGGGMKIRDMVTIAKEAEGAGFDSLYVTEAWRSGFVPLTALAMATQHVRLGPYVLNAYGRSPMLTGMSAIDLDELSGGRLLLGVGSGNRHINEDWQGVPHVEPYQKMKEYIECLKQIVRTPMGTPMKYEGKIHRMQWTPAVQPLRESIPIYLSAIFPRMVKVAGQVADGVAIGAMGSVEYLRDVLQPRVREAAAHAGRDPRSLGYVMAIFVSVSDDREQARQAAREAICRLFSPLPHPYYDFLLREQGFSAAADTAQKLAPQGKFKQAAEAIPDEAIDRLTIAGTPAECRKRIAAYEGVVEEVICVNVSYSATPSTDPLGLYRQIIDLR
ncbi:MAG: LLM class flavin-dependent oxidoreductase [Deltaproteobacteria bacterium]|nr:LLM class flavin-dependent oxidoreductase [Deltaproteobacteria bacterium]